MRTPFTGAAGIRAHLEMVADLQRPRLKESGLLRSPATLLLKYGREYQIDEESFAGKRMQAHMCYRNAGMLALADDSLIYVEGYTTVYGIPIEHAWCIRHSNGAVVDPTIVPRPDDERVYYGVAFNTSFYSAELLKRQVWGIIDMNERLMKMSESKLRKGIYHG